MTDSGFFEGELKAPTDPFLDEKINSSVVPTRYREDNTAANLRKGTKTHRRLLRDHLENHNVACGRGNGKSIQTHLVILLSPTTSPLLEASVLSAQAGHSSVSPASSNTARRDLLTVTRYKDDQDPEPYEGPVLYTVQRKVLQDCKAFEVPEVQLLSVKKCVLRDKALRYFS